MLGAVGIIGKNIAQSYDRLTRLGARIVGHQYPLQRNEDIKPFFIVGCGRSGTTLLRRILIAGGEVEIPSENDLLGKAIKCYGRQRHRSWNYVCGRVVAILAANRRFADYEIPESVLVREVRALPPTSRSMAAIVDAMYRGYLRAIGKAHLRWGDKTPILAISLDRVHSIFPQARFIHLLRDGVDVVASRLSAGFSDDLVTSGHWWIRNVEACRAFELTHPDLCRLVRYEDLVTNPEAATREIADFISIRYCDEMITSLKPAQSMKDLTVDSHKAKVFEPVSRKSIGKGRAELSTDDLKLLAPVLNDELNRWGYESI